MDSIKNYMEDDHDRCDALFVKAESAVARADWAQAASDFSAFNQAMERHLGMEEGILFPAFEEAISSKEGPTGVMRLEHQQIRDILASIGHALTRHDADQFSGDADTLTILLQQHNLKEEGILYPMMDRVLLEHRAELLAAINAMPLIPQPQTAQGKNTHAHR